MTILANQKTSDCKSGQITIKLKHGLLKMTFITTEYFIGGGGLGEENLDFFYNIPLFFSISKYL